MPNAMSLCSSKPNALKSSALKGSAGFSLVEILVSVLVLAVGILGMGGLQVNSLQNSSRSVLRTQAAYLSYDILDKMRANSGEGPAYVTASSGTTFSASNCISSACDAGGLATFDVVEWKCALGESSACDALPSTSLVSEDNALPGATGTISVTDDIYTITIQWNEERDGSTDKLQTFALETTL